MNLKLNYQVTETKKYVYKKSCNFEINKKYIFLQGTGILI